MTTVWDYGNLYSARVLGRDKIHAGHGTTHYRIFLNVPLQTANALVPPDFSPFPGETGKHASVLQYADVNLGRYPGGGNNPGRCQINLVYRPLTPIQWMEAHAPAGMLTGRSAIRMKRVRIAPPILTPNAVAPVPIRLSNPNDSGPPAGGGPGSIVEGVDASDITGCTRWHVTGGTNRVVTPHDMIEITAVIDDLDVYYNQFHGAVGAYNSTWFYHIPLAPFPSKPGQLLLAGLHMAPRPTKRSLYLVKYLFLLDLAAGWAEATVSTQFQYQVVQMPVLDTTGKPTGNFKSVNKWVPQSATNTNQLIQGLNFNAIDQMMNNNWNQAS